MLFNSISFAIFLPMVFALYWAKANKSNAYQNFVLLFSSYFFYSCWDWRFLLLLIFSTALDYFSGLKLFTTDSKQQKRFWLWLSVIINVGLLGIFKYYNFFVTSFAEGLSAMGIQPNLSTLNIILPVGISFYTFHGLSYIIDIYNGKINPERNFINYAVFVSFFPLLVAGPIERATHLLPQIKKARTFDYTKAVDGLRQILWGLFKKIVIADKCAVYADYIFDAPGEFSGSTYLAGAILFAFQIYCDFSGYSDIAIGTAKLFGIDLLKNFNYPYFSRSIPEFWRRWHISLSSWFRDYLYIPMGGSKKGIGKKIRNVFVLFLVSGFWHGANWTFIVWGLVNAFYMLPSLLINSKRKNIAIATQEKSSPEIKDLPAIILTFGLTALAWIFFRAKNLEQAIDIIREIFSSSIIATPIISTGILPVLLIVLLITEWMGQGYEHPIALIGQRFIRPVRWIIYILIIFAIIYFGSAERQFIYFQF